MACVMCVYRYGVKMMYTHTHTVYIYNYIYTLCINLYHDVYVTMMYDICAANFDLAAMSGP